MDAHAFDFATGSFDAAVASSVIHIVSEPERVVAEACRVVRPGGLVAMTVPGPSSGDIRCDRYLSLWRAFTPDPTPARSAQPTDVAALSADAGLEGYRQQHLEIDLPVATPELAWRHDRSHGLAGYVRSLRPDDQRESQRRALLELQRMHHDGGIRLQRGPVMHVGVVS